MDELIYAEIADRRARREPGEDVLSLLLAARHEDGSPMSDIELRDELMTLLTAGHETTATASSWAFERLMRTPRVLERLHRPVDDDEYLDAVVKETLRIRPVIVDVARKLTAPTEIGGYTLPAGTLVLPAIAARARAARPLPRAGSSSVPSASSTGGPVVRLDPVRRRRAALHRRVVRTGRDARGAARGAAARAPRAPPRPGRSGRASST